MVCRLIQYNILIKKGETDYKQVQYLTNQSLSMKTEIRGKFLEVYTVQADGESCSHLENRFKNKSAWPQKGKP